MGVGEGEDRRRGHRCGKKEIGTGVEEEEEARASLWGRIDERDEMKG
jgi:hypothetical protein